MAETGGSLLDPLYSVMAETGGTLLNPLCWLKRQHTADAGSDKRLTAGPTLRAQTAGGLDGRHTAGPTLLTQIGGSLLLLDAVAVLDIVRCPAEARAGLGGWRSSAGGWRRGGPVLAPPAPLALGQRTVTSTAAAGRPSQPAAASDDPAAPRCAIRPDHGATSPPSCRRRRCTGESGAIYPGNGAPFPDGTRPEANRTGLDTWTGLITADADVN